MQIMESTSKIARMIHRILTRKLQDALRHYPAVALLGPRQSGKTTLALEVGKSFDARYLDLESEQDRARLADPELYLFDQREHLVILDEVHRTPGLFPVLRGLIDKSRRAGRRSGLYLLLGSASLDLLKQTGESLAGRISYIELTPFTILEAGAANADLLWTRGGFPDSMLASSGLLSLRWRQDFIRTYLERDIPQFGPRIAAETLRRFWTMLAWHQGGLVNMSQFSRSLGIDVKTVSNYMDLLVDLLLVRRLPPWHENAGKRLVRSPKVFIRDSGLTHALLGIADKDMLLSHPVAGQSWECFVIENLLDSAPADVQGYFYRTGGGAEIDLLLLWPDGKRWAVEVKRSLAPKLERGFHSAHADLSPERSFVVYPGTERYRMSETVEAVSLADLALELQQANNP
jgi:predicted AAA+ superfamily ATPase